MQLLVNGRNIEITDWIEEYIEKRVKRLERYLPTMSEVRAELAHSPTRAADDRYTVQLTLWSNGQIIRAETSTSDVFASIDAVVDKLSEQVRRFKGKYQKNKRRASVAASMKAEMEEEAPAVAEEESPAPPHGEIIRRKEFIMQPMNEDEAVEQMELVGHDFFIFYNTDTATPNVVYRRKDGNYGLLQPQLG